MEMNEELEKFKNLAVQYLNTLKPISVEKIGMK